MNLILNKEITLTIIKKFSIILFLNLSDMILTYLGDLSGYAVEVNILLAPFINNLLYFSLIKLVLPLCLFLYIYIRMLKATYLQIIKSTKYLNYLIGFYVLVNLTHIFWIINLFSCYCKSM